MDERNTKQRDRPGAILARLWRRWGADLLLVCGAAAITVGAALIWPPAGWIAGGALAIAGGVLAARSGGDADAA